MYLRGRYNRYNREEREEMRRQEWEFFKRYGVWIIIICFVLAQIVFLQETTVICRPGYSKCQVTERNFIFAKYQHSFDISKVEKFDYRYEGSPIPFYNSDRNHYWINAIDKQGRTHLFIESFHSTLEKTEKVVKELNDGLAQDPINIHVKF